MPFYDYICKECSHEFENFQSMTSEPLKECPECKKHALQKKISGGMSISIGENFSAHHENIRRMKNKD